MDTPYNYIFVCLKNHKWSNKHNNLDCYKKIWNIFHQFQSLHAQYLTQIKNVFACSKHSNLKNGQSSFFPNVLFFTNCAPFFLKIGEDFNIDDQKGKRTWINEFFFYNPFKHIWLKSVFDSENYGFWKCAFNKNCSLFMWSKAWMHNIHDIKSICSQNIFIFKMQC